MTEITKWVPLLGYILFFVGVVILVLKRCAAGAGKFPLQDDVILMRRAGETLDQRHRKLMDGLLGTVAVALAVPLLVPILPLVAIRWSQGWWVIGLLVAAGCLFVAALIWGMGRINSLAVETRNVRLGLFGERAVADQLEELRSAGYRIFHDVPCLGGGGPFNLDHVVVGKGGVAVVETKTRRKAKRGDAKANCRVEYDGRQLLWPWGRSTDELEQVTRNAEWLQKYLKKELMVEVVPMQVLAIPGWFVANTTPGPVRVMNQKQLGKNINDLKGSMTGPQEQLVAKLLTRMCSDVKYEMVA